LSLRQNVGVQSSHFNFEDAMRLTSFFDSESSPNVLKEYLLTAAVIELRGPTVDLASDSLGGFRGAVVFRKIGDPIRTKKIGERMHPTTRRL
jgi:hypothetical protein